MNNSKITTNPIIQVDLKRCLTLPILVALWLSLWAVQALAAQFEDVTTGAGITNEKAYCFSAAWGDYDKDGYPDLYIAAGFTNKHVNALYHNNRDGTFARMTGAQVGPIASDAHDSLGCAWIDFNNDGYPDMFVINGASSPSRNDLYMNNGDGTFRRASAGTLTDQLMYVSWPACADFDGDGLVDIFLAQAPSLSGPFALRLFHNTPSGKFGTVDFGSPVGYCNDAVWGDYNNDGKPDLYVCDYNSPSGLWRNDGNGQFSEMSIGLPSGNSIAHAAWGDYDNDGNLDIAIFSDTGTLLYRNDGQGNFGLVEQLTSGNIGVPAWADYDNDGYLDLLLVNGQDRAQNVALFHNNGDGTFTAVDDPLTSVTDMWLVGAWGDYDNDGFMDVVLTEQSGNNRLFHNLRDTNHWIKFKLVGTVSNRDAIGAKVRIKATIGGKTFGQMREVNGSYAVQNDLRPNFGLGDAITVDLVRVEWPSGISEVFTNLPADCLVMIVEPSLRGALAQDGKMHLSMTMSTNVVRHIETSSDLVTWTKLVDCTGTPSGAQVEFVDPDAPSIHGTRFYRMR